MRVGGGGAQGDPSIRRGSNGSSKWRLGCLQPCKVHQAVPTGVWEIMEDLLGNAALRPLCKEIDPSTLDWQETLSQPQDPGVPIPSKESTVKSPSSHLPLIFLRPSQRGLYFPMTHASWPKGFGNHRYWLAKLVMHISTHIQ